MTASGRGPTAHLGPVVAGPPVTTTLRAGASLTLWCAPAAVGAAPGGLMTVLDAPGRGHGGWRVGLDGRGLLAVESASARRTVTGPLPLLAWTEVRVTAERTAILVEALGREARVDTPDADDWVVTVGRRHDRPAEPPDDESEPVEWYGGFTGLLTTSAPEGDPGELWPALVPTDESDADRPRWHFMPPSGWMNEPHGAVYHGGRYHVFYQRNELGPFWGTITWGHAVSDNLVDWTDLGSNLVPHLVDCAPDGIWSGSTAIDESGTPVQFFTAGDHRDTPNQRVAVARPHDPGDPFLRRWSVTSPPVTHLRDAADGLAALGMAPLPGEFRDPFVWREGSVWFQLVGAGIAGAGGTALLFTASAPEGPWEFRGPLLVGDVTRHPGTGVMWELPSLVPVGTGSDGHARHALLVSPWWGGPSEHWLQHQWYWIGRWDPSAAAFHPDHEDPRPLDVGGYFTGGTPLRHPDGRVLVWSITQDLQTEVAHLRQGWAGSAGTPLRIALGPDDDLRFAYPEELAALRTGRAAVDPAGFEIGPMWELDAALDLPVGGRARVVVREGADGVAAVTLSVTRPEPGALEVELAGPAPRGVRRRRLPHVEGEPLPVRVLVDHSVVEALVAERVSLTTRAWSNGSERGRVEVAGGGGLLGADLWRLRAASMDSSRRGPGG